MTDLAISEAGSVQFPMVRHAEEIGWTPLTPDDARTKRGSEAAMFLRDELEGAIARFCNSAMSGNPTSGCFSRRPPKNPKS
ncbi:MULTISPECIES: hypothetical protein [Sphingobium]|jgi:type I restriction enzyme R subunit|uniref:hypothetical protein n=1 Tax=Sphingobium TaxID=165695 RepID=UPI0011AEB171|nr:MULTISPECIES: hypothetical protein [Sphingobium]KAA9011322.1 hypothetical protein F4U94_21120 [Sphingobium limneticum]MBU0931087.1 hypothetical protein [Alphaproteobacteria bacterium]